MNTKTILSILVLVAGLLIATSAHAEVAISEDGVTFPDDETQTSAVIVPMNCPHGDAIVWDTNAASWVCETDLSVICPCAGGETGPAGGIVVYVTDGGMHGLEAAPVDQGTAGWCAEFRDIAGVDNIGSASTPDSHSGAHNTPLISDECGDFSAARKAQAYVWPNGQTDGFLPNKEELDLVYQNSDTIGGFERSLYWSSSEENVINAWLQNFVDGSWEGNPQINSKGVRAVRAF